MCVRHITHLASRLRNCVYANSLIVNVVMYVHQASRIIWVYLSYVLNTPKCYILQPKPDANYYTTIIYHNAQNYTHWHSHIHTHSDIAQRVSPLRRTNAALQLVHQSAALEPFLRRCSGLRPQMSLDSGAEQTQQLHREFVRRISSNPLDYSNGSGVPTEPGTPVKAGKLLGEYMHGFCSEQNLQIIDFNIYIFAALLFR